MRSRPRGYSQARWACLGWSKGPQGDSLRKQNSRAGNAMPFYDANLWMLLIPTILFAAVSKAGFGSGAAFVSAAILALILPPTEALALMLPLLMLVDVAAVRAYWRQWDVRMARLLILWSGPGIVAGALLFSVVSADAIRAMMGAICLAFVAWQFFTPRAGAQLPGWAEALGGFVAGFTSFVSHAGGPAVAVVMLARGLTKTTYQATSVAVFFAINFMKFPIYAGMGAFEARTFWAALILSPVAMFGAWLGVRAHYWISDRLFFALTYVLLTLTGVRLLWVAM